jgi:NADH-quinone oxidoreductase subunit A
MMSNEYLPLGILFILATLLAFLVVGLGHLFGPRRPSARKSEPYESGMQPIGPGTRRVSVRFYLVAVLFILFDIEVVFFLPWAVIVRDFSQKGWGPYALVAMTIFVFFLMVGFIYEWKKGAMEWE